MDFDFLNPGRGDLLRQFVIQGVVPFSQHFTGLRVEHALCNQPSV